MRFKNIRATGHTKQKSLIPTQLLYDFPPSLQQKRLYDSCKNVGHKHSRQLSVKTTKASMPFNSQTNSPSTSLAFCRQYHARFTNASWKLSGHWSHKTKRPHSNPVTLWLHPYSAMVHASLERVAIGIRQDSLPSLDKMNNARCIKILCVIPKLKWRGRLRVSVVDKNKRCVVCLEACVFRRKECVLQK